MATMPDFSGVKSGVSTTSNVKYRITAPDGKVFELEGPDGASDEDLISVIANSYQPEAPKPIDERGWGEVGLSQLANTAKGLLTGPVKGAWALGEGLGDIAGRTITGDARGAMDSTGKLLSGAYHAVADPIEHTGEMFREAFDPASSAANIMDPERLSSTAEGMGGQLSGLAMQARAPKLMSELPEYLQTKANAIRENATQRTANTKISDAPSFTAAATRGARKVAGAVSDVRAPLYEKAAAALGKMQTAPEYQGRQPLGPQSEIPMNIPDETFQHTGRQPLGPQPELEMPAAPVEAPFEYPGQQPLGPQAEIPMSQMPDWSASTQPQAMVPRNPNADMLRSQLRANDGAARWANANADYVYEIMPELRGLERGTEAFRVQATNGFKNLEANMKTAQQSVPPETRVPTGDIKAALGEVQNQIENVSANLPAKAKIALEIDKLGKPSLTWHEFLILKDEFRKIPNFMRDRYLKQAYGAYMDAASKAGGPALAKANKDFSTAMRLNEHAGIDMSGGRGQGQPLR